MKIFHMQTQQVIDNALFRKDTTGEIIRVDILPDGSYNSSSQDISMSSDGNVVLFEITFYLSL